MDTNLDAKVVTSVEDPNAEAKAALEAAGISAEMAAFAIDERANRVMNSEGLELGDKFTIVGMASKPDGFKNDKDELISYAAVNVTGDRDTISLNRLVGSPKEKYFADGRNDQKMEYDPAKVLRLPRRIGDAMVAIQKLSGHTYQLVEIAEGCGRDADREYYRFVEV